MLKGPLMTAIWLALGVIIGAGVLAAALRSRLHAGARAADRAAELERELVRAQADLEHERALSHERLETVSQGQERMSESFKALSAEALQSSMAQLAELSRVQLQAARMLGLSRQGLINKMKRYALA